MSDNKNMAKIWQIGVWLLTCSLPYMAFAEDGVSDSEIVIGGVMDLEGRSSGLGQGMKAGLEAALKNQVVGGRKIRLSTANDSYTPKKTIEATTRLIEDKVLLFAGNVGTPTAKVSLPILAEKGIPAIGFFSGAGLLRPGEGDIINYRASYVQEIGAVIEEALQQGVKPEGICAYVQNDADGMAGVQGIADALKDQADTETIQSSLKNILKLSGDNPPRNGIGPVGVYTRNTFSAREGYRSLKEWEINQETSCQLVVTTGTYEAIARFIAYADSKGEPWVYSAVSSTGANEFAENLARFDITDHIIMTQVVPLENSNLPIVQEAKNALGRDYGYVSQEGYIVGQLLLHGLRKLEEEEKAITRRNLMAAIKGKRFDLGGLGMDFSDDNQGSDLVVMTTLSGDKWIPMRDAIWRQWLDPNSSTTN